MAQDVEHRLVVREQAFDDGLGAGRVAAADVEAGRQGRADLEGGTGEVAEVADVALDPADPVDVRGGALAALGGDGERADGAQQVLGLQGDRGPQQRGDDAGGLRPDGRTADVADVEGDVVDVVRQAGLARRGRRLLRQLVGPAVPQRLEEGLRQRVGQRVEERAGERVRQEARVGGLRVARGAPPAASVVGPGARERPVRHGGCGGPGGSDVPAATVDLGTGVPARRPHGHEPFHLRLGASSSRSRRVRHDPGRSWAGCSLIRRRRRIRDSK